MTIEYILPVKPGDKVKFLEFYQVSNENSMVKEIETIKLIKDVVLGREYTIEYVQNADSEDFLHQIVRVKGIKETFSSAYLDVPRVEIQGDEIKRLMKALLKYI